MFQLRPYQETFLCSIREQVEAGHRAVLAVMPTGSGKGVAIAELVRRSAAVGERVLILVHRGELVADLSERLKFCDVNHGVIASGQPASPELPVQIGTVQTVVRRLDQLASPGIIIQDEAHHAIRDNTWGKIISRFPDATLIGATATPERLSGEGLGADADGFFTVMVEGPSTAWLTEQGFLARARVYAPPNSATGQPIRKRAGDFDMGDAARVYGSREIYGDAVDHYRRFLFPRTAIAFCCNIDHANDVTCAFENAGIRTELLTGKQPLSERREILGKLAAGEVKVVTSCMVISEGVDVPSVGGCIMLRPTMSLALHLQMCGRALRPKVDGADAVLLDHVGNVSRLGFPTDSREWSLAGKEERMSREQQCGNGSARAKPTIVTTAGELEELQPGGGSPVVPRSKAKRGSIAALLELQHIAELQGRPTIWAIRQWIAQSERRR
ncbi:MAG: DEAD/DEAH box helicase [Prochlorococcaceae cyanobacterium]